MSHLLIFSQHMWTVPCLSDLVANTQLGLSLHWQSRAHNTLRNYTYGASSNLGKAHSRKTPEILKYTGHGYSRTHLCTACMLQNSSNTASRQQRWPALISSWICKSILQMTEIKTRFDATDRQQKQRNTQTVQVVCNVLTKKVFKRRPIMSHEIINHSSPWLDARRVRLEETWVHHQFEGLALPRSACVLVTAQARQHLRARSIAWQIVNAVVSTQACISYKTEDDKH